MAEQRVVVVVVEEGEAAMEALRWAVTNFLRRGDWITLFHAFPSTRSRNRKRLLRLRGFQLALSFKDLCNYVPEAKVEIVVKEGETEIAVAALVDEIHASTLLLGLHDNSFLYRISTSQSVMRNLDCRILAIKNQTANSDEIHGLEFSQVEVTRLWRDVKPQKIPFRILPVCFQSKSGKKMIARRS
ncbi:adenine nucleotide alpha hydrolases-like superfamily protein [Wolffia australiana]